MLDFSHFDSLFAIMSYFTDNNVCKQFLAQQRWSDGDVICPICGTHHCTTRKDGRYHCCGCKHNFSVTVGTIFENTKISLVKWFVGIYLVSAHKKGVSSHQLGRDLKVTQKTAWYMLTKLRTLFGQELTILEEEVEMDEAYIGGKEKWKHESKHVEGTQGRSTKTKTPLFGMVQRKGGIIVQKVSDTKESTLAPIIKKYVAENSVLFTDEYQPYAAFMQKNGSKFSHSVVFHNEKEFVKGNAHTNTIEGFWSHFKRMVYGIYHHVSVEHLQQYVDEMVYRWNTRKSSEGSRFEYVFSKAAHILRQSDVRLGCTADYCAVA